MTSVNNITVTSVNNRRLDPVKEIKEEISEVLGKCSPRDVETVAACHHTARKIEKKHMRFNSSKI